MITRRLAASGVGVHDRGRGDNCELVILNVPGARSCLTLTGTGHARWHYEPPHGAATSAATLTGIILHILGAPTLTATPARTATGRSRSRASWGGACKTGA